MNKNNLLEQFALAIKRHEGWFAPCIKYPRGTISYQNNNPGNLRWSKFQIGKYKNFAVFKTYNDGWQALLYDITLKAEGKTKLGLGPNSTLYDFFAIWAPSSNGNKPKQYAEAVAGYLNIKPTTTLAEIMKPNTNLDNKETFDKLKKENTEFKKHINGLETTLQDCQAKLTHYKKAFEAERDKQNFKPNYTISEILSMLLQAIFSRKK